MVFLLGRALTTGLAQSNLPKPLQKHPPDLLFIRHPLAECFGHSAGEFTLNDLLSLISISGFNRPETETAATASVVTWLRFCKRRIRQKRFFWLPNSTPGP